VLAITSLQAASMACMLPVMFSSWYLLPPDSVNDALMAWIHKACGNNWQTVSCKAMFPASRNVSCKLWCFLQAKLLPAKDVRGARIAEGPVPSTPLGRLAGPTRESAHVTLQSLQPSPT
jgi:hypothetical protein